MQRAGWTGKEKSRVGIPCSRCLGSERTEPTARRRMRLTSRMPAARWRQFRNVVGMKRKTCGAMGPPAAPAAAVGNVALARSVTGGAAGSGSGVVCGEEGQGVVCEVSGCSWICAPYRRRCKRHGGRRLCQQDGCEKFAQAPSSFCKGHGGGYRCQVSLCKTSAPGRSFRCKEHLSQWTVVGARITLVNILESKACGHPHCENAAVWSAYLCKIHGGGRRCTSEGCPKSASGATEFCVEHGGGQRCVKNGCRNSAVGRSKFCIRHGGGRRCKVKGCSRSARSSSDLCRGHQNGEAGPCKRRKLSAMPDSKSFTATTEE